MRRPASTPACRGGLRAVAGGLLALFAAQASGLDPDRAYQDFIREQWSIEEGLPQVSVLGIAQDPDGYMWVGTQKGIARFDGHRFRSFDAGQTGGATPTNVRKVVAGPEGDIWFLHDRGVLRRTGQSFVDVPADAAAGPFVDLASSGADVALVTQQGMVRVGPDGASRDLALPAGATQVTFDATGGAWVAHGGGVSELRDAAESVLRLPVDTGRTRITQLAVSPEILWIGTGEGLLRHDVRSRVTGWLDPIGRKEITALLAAASGELWVGTADGLYRVSRDLEVTRIGAAAFGAMPWITALFEDRDRNLWIGTRTDGLVRLSDGWIDRRALLHGDQPLVSWSVEAGPGGAVYSGAEYGVFRIDTVPATLVVDGASLPNPVAYELAFDDAARLWIGTRAGLARIDAVGAAPRTVEALAGIQVNAIVHAGGGLTWIGTSDGLFEANNDVFRRITTGQPGAASRIRGVLPMPRGGLLLATEAGVREFTNGVLSQPPWAAALDGAFVAGIDRVAPDLLVVATVDRGFGVVRDGRLRMADHDPTLATLTAWGARAAEGLVFVSAAEGILTMPLDGLHRFAAGDADDFDWRVPASLAGTLRGSVRARCCNGGARSRIAIQGRKVWLPTIEGAIALDLDDLDRAVEVPVVHVEGAWHGDRRDDRGTDAGPVLIDDARRDLTIAYTAIAHRDPKGLRFSYRLDGFDADWVDAGTRREAFYTNLPAGDYTFRVRAESAARIASVNDASLPIRVVPAWHERTGTRAGAVIALAALLLLAMRAVLTLRERAFAARETRLQRVVDERTAELAHANARLREANQALAQESETDPLTGLPNRRWLSGHLGDWLREGTAAPGDGTCALLVMFDLDRFKDINARLGHAAGDALLRQFGAMLERLAGADGKVLRWGGEEFLLVARGVPRAQASARVAALWRAAQEHLHPAPDGTPILLPSSVGYSTHPPAAGADALPWRIALELADAAAWRARIEARNGWGGLLLAEGSDPAQLAAGIEGRLDALLRAGVLRWERIGAATAR